MSSLFPDANNRRNASFIFGVQKLINVTKPVEKAPFYAIPLIGIHRVIHRFCGNKNNIQVSFIVAVFY